MGIPKYFRSISERFPLINQTINMGLRPEIDCLYLDMNGIVHTATHANGNNDIDQLSEAQMFLQIFQYIEQLIELAQPQQLLYMALDGVAPRAKMNQQRQRRFRSGQALQQRVEEQILIGAETGQSVEVFDTNCITPGTEFMDRLSAHIQYYIRRRMKEDQKWQKLKVIFSGSDSIGEGEHKIMAYIRAQRMRDDYNPNLRHCIYGLDADLIMLSLASHEHNTVLLREEVIFGQQSDKYKQRKHLLKPGQFQFLHISLFREYLDYDLNFSADCDWYDLERVIDDFVLLSYLAGNDFLPSLPSIRIGLGSLDVIFAVYRQNIVAMGGYLTAYGAINIERLIQYFGYLSQHEEALLHAVNDDTRRINEFKAEQLGLEDDGSTQFRIDPATGLKIAVFEQVAEPIPNFTDGESIPLDALFGMTLEDGVINQDKVEQLAKAQANEFMDKLEDQMEFHSMSLEELADLDQNKPQRDDSFDELLSKGFFYDEDKDELIRITDEVTIENYYYKFLPEVAKGGQDSIEKLCIDYIEGLYWVYKYYYQCVPSWKWQFTHYEAPLLTSLAKINHENCKFEFDIGKPFTPMQQLMGVLPPQSAGLLPKPLRPLMLESDSKINHFYPLVFDVDMTGKRWEHEGVAKIPFIDEDLLISTMNEQVLNLFDPFRQIASGQNESQFLKPNESRRNINSQGDMLFEYDPSITTPYQLVQGYTQILRLTGSIPEADLRLYEGHQEETNPLYFADLPQCPVKCTLYINSQISPQPQHLFNRFGIYGDVANDEYKTFVMTRVQDNPFILTEYKNEFTKASFQDAIAWDKAYINGKVLDVPRFVPIRLLFSQQPLPGYPTLKIILQSYKDGKGHPLRRDESRVKPKNKRFRQKDEQISIDDLFDNAQDDCEIQIDENAPVTVFSRLPIMVFGKKSLMPSLSISFKHDPHVLMYNQQYLERTRINDGLNKIQKTSPIALQARKTAYSAASFSQLDQVANRFQPGRIVWADFPYLRPGRVEFICNGETVAVPLSYSDSSMPSYANTDSGLNYKIIPMTPFHRKVYYNEQQAMMARYKHMLGINIEQHQCKVIVCIAPLLDMITTRSGELEPRFDTEYHSRKTTQASSQNGISAQYGNLNPLPGLIFNIPQLVWASPPVQPDSRWMLNARQPLESSYTKGASVVGLTQDTYGYLGVVDKVIKPIVDSNQQLSVEQLDAISKPKIQVNWQQIPPSVPLLLQTNQSGGVSMSERLNIFAQIAQLTKLRFFPAFELSRALGISGKTLFRITDTIFFKIGYKQYNIGLQLHANKHSLLLPDYCRYVNQWLLDNAQSQSGASNPQQNERSVGDAGDRWEYSHLAVILIKKFYQTFPEIFYYLDDSQNIAIEGNIDVGDLLMYTWQRQKRSDPDYEQPFTVKHQIPSTLKEAYLSRVQNFIKTLGLGDSVMVSTTSRQLNTMTVRKLEQMILSGLTKKEDEVVEIRPTALAVGGAASQPISLNAGQIKTIIQPIPYTPQAHLDANKERFENVDKNHEIKSEHLQFDLGELLLPSTKHPYCPLESLRNVLLSDVFTNGGGSSSVSKQQFFRLCDRVMVSRSDTRIPLGSTGTIIGLHSQFLPLSTNQTQSGDFALNVQGGENLFLEILLDAPSLVATTLRGKTISPLGVLVPATTVLNLAQPVWMLERQTQELAILGYEELSHLPQAAPAQRATRQPRQPRQPRQQQTDGQQQFEEQKYQQQQPQQQQQQQQHKPRIVKTPVTTAAPVTAPVVTATPVVAAPIVSAPVVAKSVTAAPVVATSVPVVAAPVPAPPKAVVDNSVETALDDFLDAFE